MWLISDANMRNTVALLEEYAKELEGSSADKAETDDRVRLIRRLLGSLRRCRSISKEQGKKLRYCFFCLNETFD